MIRKRIKLILCLLAFTSGVTAGEVEVFYSSAMGQAVDHVSSSEHSIKYYDLDAGAIAQAQLNRLLPKTKNKNEVKASFNKLINSEKGMVLVEKISSGYQGVGRAFQLGVEKLPAVVFNSKKVVYGTADLSTALIELGAYE